jgi:hypothetical protein
MTVSYLTPLQLNAAAGLLQNTGLSTNAVLTTNLSSYNSSSLIAPYLVTLANSAAANLSNTTIATLKTLASNTCPALADSAPAGYATLTVTNTLFTGLISTTAATYMGNGDLTKFAQALSQAQSYADQTGIFINSAINSQTYLADTFTGMNDMITGGITQVSLATSALGTDLANLGRLLNLALLDDFGSPLGLIQQIYTVTGTIPSVSIVFISAGVPVDVVLSLNNPTVSVTDGVQRLMYEAMTQITGSALNQILSVMQVTTPGITTMADLLNPLRLFPNSYQTLTVPTKFGKRAIYVNSAGSVNQSLATELPSYVLNGSNTEIVNRGTMR